MNKSEQLSILVTFVVGMFAGAYLYLTDFAGKVMEFALPDAETASEFTIIGEVYGGCQLRNTCPSFQIQQDGTYRYLYSPGVGEEQVLRRGTLSLTTQRELRNVLTTKSLVQQSQSIDPAMCNSFVDGIDVRYEITIDGTVYKLDSCGTAVDGGGRLWITLGSVWDFFQTDGNK